MPFRSKAQQRMMFAKHPKMAKEWADKMTPGQMMALPERKAPKKPPKRAPKRKR